MKRIIAVSVSLIAVAVALFWVIPALAAPNDNASHVAQCATQMGGQHVADHAQNMDQGVSNCAKM